MKLVMNFLIYLFVHAFIQMELDILKFNVETPSFYKFQPLLSITCMK